MVLNCMTVGLLSGAVADSMSDTDSAEEDTEAITDKEGNMVSRHKV